MGMKAAERIVEALNELMEAYCELQESIERDFAGRDTDTETSELSAEVDSAIVTEVRAAVESVMEGEDYSAEEIASVISTLTDSLEEIDPDVFEDRRAAAGSDDDDDDDYYDEDDLDDDDLDEEEDDDDEDEDEDE